MFAGTVTLKARIAGLQFDRLEISPATPGVIKAVLSARNGTLKVEVEISGVATEKDGERLAAQATEQVCDRMAHAGCWAIWPPLIRASLFRLLAPPAFGVRDIGVRDDLRFTGGASAVVTPGPAELAALKGELELPARLGEQHFGMFRAALASGDRVVQFMQLYQLLLMLCDDDQEQVDAFIRSEEPSVPQTQHSRKKQGILETIYSRLRNEFAHRRFGIDRNETNRQMASYAPALARLTKRAIEVHP
jgi:hypothetical protein